MARSADDPTWFQIAWNDRQAGLERRSQRCFVGLHLDPHQALLRGALVRIWGHGWHAVPDVMACSQVRDTRFAALAGIAERASHGPMSPSELADRAAQAVAPLIHVPHVDATQVRAVGLLNLGRWADEAYADRAFTSGCQTASLARWSSLSVVDDFPSRDLVHGGRGGPLEAAGLWWLLADRGLLPGRRIRALVEIDQWVRVILLPPRPPDMVPLPVMAWEVGPGWCLLQQMAQRVAPHTRLDADLDKLSVQGKVVRPWLDAWHALQRTSSRHWTPHTPPIDEWLEAAEQARAWHDAPLDGVVATWAQFVADCVVDVLQNQLPRSQPIGELILAGCARSDALIQHRLQQAFPAVDLSRIDDRAVPSDAWRAVAAALLAMMHVDQIPANAPALTGVESPRILGTMTPGPPLNWHRVLADMAQTLPDRVPLRNAI